MVEMTHTHTNTLVCVRRKEKDHFSQSQNEVGELDGTVLCRPPPPHTHTHATTGWKAARSYLQDIWAVKQSH